MAKPKTAEAKKVDPFKTRKTKEVDTKVDDTITPPKAVAEAIDEFRNAQDQAKHFEGEMTIHKEAVLKFAQKEYAKRLLNGLRSSFKILGNESMVTYITTVSSAGLTDDDLASIEERWGKKAAEELVVRDYASIRFDPQVLEANYDQIVEALQTLPEDILENLFKPMLMKASPQAVEMAKKYAKDAEEVDELLQQLKIKNYIK
jgi:hypothetical protein